MVLKCWIYRRQPAQDKTPNSDKRELSDGEGDRFGEGIQDLAGGGIRDHRGDVPCSTYCLRPFSRYHTSSLERQIRTTSLGETGAFSASAISWAFWLILPFLVLMVLIASLKLFCRPCLVVDPNVVLLANPARLFLLGNHFSLCMPPVELGPKSRLSDDSLGKGSA